MTHRCHWPDCPAVVPPKMWGCSKHWFMLPLVIRKAIWRHYVAGQEITKTPSKDYIWAANQAQLWIAQYIKKTTTKDRQ